VKSGVVRLRFQNVVFGVSMNTNTSVRIRRCVVVGPGLWNIAIVI
jgi:hypothetical protein